MRRTLFSLILLLCAATIYAQGVANRAEWRFTKGKSAASEQFLTMGRYPAAVGAEGATLSFRHKGRLAAAELNDKGFPTATSVRGDYWLFELPAALPAGTVVDVFLPFTGNEGENNRFALEYRDGSRWRCATELLSTTSHKHLRRAWQAVRITRGTTRGGKVELRLRQADRDIVRSTIASPSSRGQQPQIIIYDNAVPRDTLRMLFLGNSYTYYHTYPVIFKEIAWHEGHYADCDIFISGGYTIRQHLTNPHSVEYVDRGGYDYVMLQDQSVLPVLNGTADDSGSTANLQAMVERVYKGSSAAKVFIEITWGRRFGNNNLGNYEKYAEKYPQFFADYDAMQNRLIENIAAEAEQCGIAVNPLGLAWQIVMHERPDINLYHIDNHHQSYAGSYLAAAVAYLAVYGEKFGSNPADCKLDAQTAAYLRSVAERVVLGGERWGGK